MVCEHDEVTLHCLPPQRWRPCGGSRPSCSCCRLWSCPCWNASSAPPPEPGRRRPARAARAPGTRTSSSPTPAWRENCTKCFTCLGQCSTLSPTAPAAVVDMSVSQRNVCLTKTGCGIIVSDSGVAIHKSHD